MGKGFYSDGRPWPKLSETLKGRRAPGTCQRCDQELPIVPWVECDNDDKATKVIVLLCEPCSDRIVEPHPRLYIDIHEFTPVPGMMAICVACKHRDQLACTHPAESLRVTIEEPMRGFIDGTTKGGGRRCGRAFIYYPTPATVCSGREVAP